MKNNVFLIIFGFLLSLNSAKAAAKAQTKSPQSQAMGSQNPSLIQKFAGLHKEIPFAMQRAIARFPKDANRLRCANAWAHWRNKNPFNPSDKNMIRFSNIVHGELVFAKGLDNGDEKKVVPTKWTTAFSEAELSKFITELENHLALLKDISVESFLGRSVAHMSLKDFSLSDDPNLYPEPTTTQDTSVKSTIDDVELEKEFAPKSPMINDQHSNQLFIAEKQSQPSLEFIEPAHDAVLTWRQAKWIKYYHAMYPKKLSASSSTQALNVRMALKAQGLAVSQNLTKVSF